MAQFQTRTPTFRSKLQKPRMKLHGAWNYGYSLDLHCIDETSRHDSSCIIEILAQSIQYATEFANSFVLFGCYWLEVVHIVFC